MVVAAVSDKNEPRMCNSVGPTRKLRIKHTTGVEEANGSQRGCLAVSFKHLG